MQIRGPTSSERRLLWEVALDAAGRAQTRRARALLAFIEPDRLSDKGYYVLVRGGPRPPLPVPSRRMVDRVGVIEVPASTLSRWVRVYNIHGAKKLLEGARLGRPRTYKRGMLTGAIRVLLRSSPRRDGHAARWTLRALTKALAERGYPAVSRETVRRVLARDGFTYDPTAKTWSPYSGRSAEEIAAAMHTRSALRRLGLAR